jgi:hypothetical protein
VREGDRQRHQFRGIADRITEHQTLIAGTLGIQRIHGTLDAGFVSGVHTLGDIR